MPRRVVGIDHANGVVTWWDEASEFVDPFPASDTGDALALAFRHDRESGQAWQLRVLAVDWAGPSVPPVRRAE